MSPNHTNDPQFSTNSLEADDQHEPNHHVRHLQDTNDKLRRKIFELYARLDAVEDLAAARGQELAAAELYLSKANSVSKSDLVEEVQRLNKEIFQAAAFLGDLLIYRAQEAPADQLQLLNEDLSARFGPLVVDFFCQKAHSGKAYPLLAQITIQILLIGFVHEKVASWSKDKKFGEGLVAIYKQIRETEMPAVAGRWRSLTRSRLPSGSTDWKSELLDELIDLFKVFSWDVEPAQHCVVFEDKLEPIFKAVEDLKTSLGEKYTTEDVVTALVSPGSAFNSTCMTSVYQSGSQNESDYVVGTVGLGLTGHQFVQEDILPAQVVLSSTIFGIITEARE